MKNLKKSIGIGVVLVVTLTVIVSWALANSETPTTYYACVNNSSGTIKVWTEPTDCGTNEFPIQWNNVGPKGDKGDPGPPGPSSEAFATGRGDIELPLESPPKDVDVIALELPAGEYVSNVTFVATNDGGGEAFVSCHYDYIDSGGRYPLPGQHWQSGGFAGTVVSTVSHAHTHAITLGEPTKVIVVCQTNWGPDDPDVVINHMEWNVIKVGTLNEQQPPGTS
jgi:hypothetical protein